MVGSRFGPLARGLWPALTQPTDFSGDFKRWWQLGRYYRLATELAFDKRRLARFPGERDTRERIVQLRGQTTELGKRLNIG